MGGITNAITGMSKSVSNVTQGVGKDTGNKLGSQLAPLLNSGTQNTSHIWSQASDRVNAGGVKDHVANCLQSRGFSPSGAQQLVQGNLPDVGSDLALLSKHLNDSRQVFERLSNASQSLQSAAGNVIGNLR